MTRIVSFLFFECRLKLGNYLNNILFIRIYHEWQSTIYFVLVSASFGSTSSALENSNAKLPHSKSIRQPLGCHRVEVTIIQVEAPGTIPIDGHFNKKENTILSTNFTIQPSDAKKILMLFHKNRYYNMYT